MKTSRPNNRSKKPPTRAKKASAQKGKAVAGKGARKSAAPKRPRSRKSVPDAVTSAPKANPQALALARRIAELVTDKKALDVVILDVRGKTSYADYLVIASGESERQVNAMADNVLSELKTEGHRPLGHEGTETGQWVLLDYGEVVANLFYADVRSFYDLEGLWVDAPREKVA